MPMPADVSDWPARERREPGLANPARLTLKPLSLAMRRAVAREVAPSGGGRVLDVGCGDKPYLPFFTGVATDYVGLDIHPGAHVDVVGSADSLPFESGSFDVVVSTQMLEHSADPPRVIAEAQRVLRPGGVLLLSTHGTTLYHPNPADFWRWTHEGLAKLLRDNGDWSRIQIEGAGGTVACFGYLFGLYIGAATRRRILRPLGRLVLVLVNSLFAVLDRLIPLRHPRPYTLISNFFVAARKSSDTRT